MSVKLLLPSRFKQIGWWILIPATIAGIILGVQDFDPKWIQARTFILFGEDILGRGHFASFIYTNITNTVVGAAFLVGGLLVGFSREKVEDEFIANLRLSSLLWAVWVSYLLLLLTFLLVYGTSFLYVMIYNMFTVLILFIVRFNVILYKSKKSVPDEK